MACLASAAVLWGCASPPPIAPAPAPPPLPVPAPLPAPAPAPPVAQPASLPHYRCDNQLEFDVRFVDDTAVIQTKSQGTEVLLRDAGGVTPQQSVYSNAKLRAEFGLGTLAREAMLRYLASPQVVKCVRD